MLGKSYKRRFGVKFFNKTVRNEIFKNHGLSLVRTFKGFQVRNDRIETE